MYNNKEIKRINAKRRLYWIVNAILHILLKLNFFRKKSIWIYGAWEGNQYDDNSRYLFEYVSENHPEIQSVWLSTNESIVKQVMKKGYRAECSYSFRGIKTQLKAGVFFYTNGMEDIGNIALVQGAVVFGLWHGTGMKNVYFMQEGSKKGIMAMLKHLKDELFSVTHQDYIIATSNEVSIMRQQTYRMLPDQVLITGQPRNDVFKKKIEKQDVLTGLTNANDYRYILYMPTYRPYENTIVEECVSLLAKDRSFIKYLEDNHIVFLLKLHYLTKINKDMVKFPLMIISNDDISSTQELLAISDCLITDYSGCCIDFALTNKPILLYAPDFLEYCKKQGIKKEWHSIYKENAYTDISTLIEGVKKSMSGNPELLIDEIINKWYEAPDIANTIYSENVYNEVNRIIARKGL